MSATAFRPQAVPAASEEPQVLLLTAKSPTIDGALNANGNIFLLNANGILIDSSAKINVGGFVASTLDVPDTASFGSGSNTFTQGSTASSSTVPSVVNMGTIQTNRNGGYVALLGATVSNQGTINAGNEGTVALAAGNQIVLNFNGNSLVGVTVSDVLLNALVENKGAIYADGGKVIAAGNGRIGNKVQLGSRPRR